MQKELLKEKIKENYGKIALEENIDFCCSPSQEVCCSNTNNISKEQISTIIGYKVLLSLGVKAIARHVLFII